MTPPTRLFSKYLIHFFLICQISAIPNEREDLSFLSRLLYRRRGGNRGSVNPPIPNPPVTQPSGARSRHHREQGNRGTPRVPPTNPPKQTLSSLPSIAPSVTPTNAGNAGSPPPVTSPPVTSPPTPAPTAPTPTAPTSTVPTPTVPTPTAPTPPVARLQQVGNDITGSRASENFGHSISLAINAARIAIGAPNSADANNTVAETGAAFVFEQIGDIWEIIDEPIYGAETEELLGEMVSLSGDGSDILITAPSGFYVTVFEFVDGIWSQKGESFEESLFGSISRDGTRVAVVGIVNYILSEFDVTTSNWTMLSGTPTGNNVPKIALSGTGTTLGLSYPKDSTNAANAGMVTVMSYQGNPELRQVGNSLYGVNANDQFGHALALSNNGKVLAVGTFSSNYVNVYSIVGDTWVLKGQQITEVEASFGRALALSNNGLKIIIGQTNYDNGRGRAIVYQFENNAWVQVGDPIVGDDQSLEGYSVSISPDGVFVASGTPDWMNNGEEIGRVRVFRIIDS